MPDSSGRLHTALVLALAALCLVLIAAHVYRAGQPLLAGGALALVGLLLVRRPWAMRALQFTLVVGAIEWLRTLITLAMARAEAGQPYLRLVAILGIVAALTGFCALALRSAAARRFFEPIGDRADGPVHAKTR